MRVPRKYNRRTGLLVATLLHTTVLFRGMCLGSRFIHSIDIHFYLANMSAELIRYHSREGDLGNRRDEKGAKNFLAVEMEAKG